MNTQDPEIALGRLSRVLGDYQRIRGQSSVRVLHRAGLNLSLQLHRLFRGRVPREGTITRAAASRGFRMGRDDAPAGGAATGISPTAAKRASAKLQGYSSVLALITGGDHGRVRARVLGIGKRGRLSRGRTGRGRYHYALSGASREDQAKVAAQARALGAKRLNFRALATIEEINLRETGRRFMAVSWLYKRWRKLSSGDARRADGSFRVLQNLNPRSRLNVLGEARLDSSPANNEATLALSSRVPGVETVGRRYGLFTRALHAVADDMASYAAEQESKLLASELRRSLSTV